MDAEIHTNAIVDKGADVGEDVSIGPFSVIEPNVVIGDGTVLHAHVVLRSGTRIGKDCEVHFGAILGGPPQDLKYKGEESHLVIGDRNQIREYVTMHRATGEGAETRIGDDGYFMAYSHVGHNATVGNGVNIANCTALGGHVEIGDNVVVGGYTGFHQFIKVGEYAMVGGAGAVFENIPPYMMTEGGYRSHVCALNTVGLMRANFDPETRGELKRAYRVVYRSNLTKEQAIEKLESDFSDRPTIKKLVGFLKESDRGISRPPVKNSVRECQL
ncbi:MAG: acyl-ACP--UDP-N-acetylglucosamine O-acyltransferase [bacterium]